MTAYSISIPLIGLSRDPKHFTRGLFRDLRKWGFDVQPVNPKVAEIEGVKCFASVRDISPAPELVLVGASASSLEAIAKDCIAAGVKRVWFLRNMGGSEAQRRAVKMCRDAGLEVIDSKCPYMYIPDAGFPHNFHGWLARLFGSYSGELEDVLKKESADLWAD